MAYKNWCLSPIVVPYIIYSGQSNATGYGLIADLTERPELQGPISKIKIYSSLTNSMENIEAGVNLKASEDFGPELSSSYGIREKLVEEGFSGDMYIIKHARGATGVIKDDVELTLHPEEDTEIFWELEREIRFTKNNILDLGLIPFCIGFIWVHGPHDAGDETKSLAYEEATKRLYNGIQEETRITGLGLPVIQMIDTLTEQNVIYSYVDNVRTAKTNFAALYESNSTVEENGKSLVDATHFDSAGLLSLGDDIASSWSIDGTPTNI